MCGGGNPIDDLVSSVGDTLASIDPGPAIGNALAESDKFVNREIPGGYALPALVAAAIAAPELAPFLLESGAEAGPTLAELGAEVGPTLSELGVEAGPTLAELGVEAGPTYSEFGYTGLEPEQFGPSYGEMGYEGINNGANVAASDAAAAAANAGLTPQEILSNANRVRNLAKLLTGSDSGLAGKKIPTATDFQDYQNMAIATNPQEMFGGLYESNKNPFNFQNPLASALTKDSSGYDVSGTGGGSLNASKIAKLL